MPSQHMLVHKLDKAKVNGEEDIGCPPVHQISFVVLLLGTGLALEGDYRGVLARNGTQKGVEVAEDQVCLR